MTETIKIGMDKEFIIKLAYHKHLKTGLIDKPVSIRTAHGDNTIKMLNPVRLVMLLFFWIFVFLPELIKANNGMVKTVFSNKPLKQGIIKLEVKGITDRYALANLADCITMTPGTITMDISREGDRYFYYIHWIDMETEDPEKAGEMIKGRFERWIGRIWR